MSYRWRSLLAVAAGLALAVVSAGAAENPAYIFATDYMSGGILVSMSPDGTNPSGQLLTLNSECRLRSYDGYLYIVERWGADNVIRVHPDSLEHVRQLSTGNGSNPADIAFASATKAYVTRYDETSLWVINPTTMTKTGEIDLSSLADRDGIPETADAVVFEGRLFVVCQRLNRDNSFSPDTTSVVAVIDVGSDELVDTDSETAGVQPIEISLKNPYDSSVEAGSLFLACSGSFLDQTDGGIEVVNMATLLDAGVILDGGDLGGDAAFVTVESADRGYVTVNEPYPSTVGWVYAFDPLASALGEKLEGVTSPSRVVAKGDYVYVLDRSTSGSGVYIFDANSLDMVAGPVSFALPPADMVFVGPGPAGIGDKGVRQVLPETLTLGPAYPNPSNAGTIIPFELAKPDDIKLEVYDATGRLVRSLSGGYRPAGSYRARWDGLDERGGPAASGIYFVRLSGAASGTRNVKVTILK